MTFGLLPPPVPQADAAVERTPLVSVCTHFTPPPPKEVTAREVVVAFVLVAFTIVKLVMVEVEELASIPPEKVESAATEKVEPPVKLMLPKPEAMEPDERAPTEVSEEREVMVEVAIQVGTPPERERMLPLVPAVVVERAEEPLP